MKESTDTSNILHFFMEFQMRLGSNLDLKLSGEFHFFDISLLFIVSMEKSWNWLDLSKDTC